MQLPKKIREEFRRFGRAGGHTRAHRMAPAARKAVARRAAAVRWVRARFGASSFEELGLPGGDLVDTGLADLSAGRSTKESLLVSIAAPRLQREGVPIGAVETDAEDRLYRLLSATDGDLAHARYGAYLRRIVSFADACRAARRERG